VNAYHSNLTVPSFGPRLRCARYEHLAERLAR
jgi:hypothetical protein